jgi:RNA polymerase sigma-32 factor
MTKENSITTLSSTNKINLNLTRSSDSFLHYIQEIQKFPVLTAEEEYEYGMRFKKTGDKEAAKMLVQSHLRLVVKMAMKFRSYGLPVTDLVSEGNVGLIQAVKKFDPEKGFRFSTYAMWWIRAYIQEHVLRSWSLVKIGTTVAQKKLFFNLRKIKKRIGKSDESTSALAPDQIKRVAHDLNVSEKEVVEMDSRLQNSDTSLNNLISEEGEEEIGNNIAANEETQEQIAIDNQEKSRRETLLRQAFSVLNEREKDILIKRQMSEVNMTLEELSKAYNISRERIRQIENNALEKIKKEIFKLTNANSN